MNHTMKDETNKPQGCQPCSAVVAIPASSNTSASSNALMSVHIGAAASGRPARSICDRVESKTRRSSIVTITSVVWSAGALFLGRAGWAVWALWALSGLGSLGCLVLAGLGAVAGGWHWSEWAPSAWVLAHGSAWSSRDGTPPSCSHDGMAACFSRPSSLSRLHCSDGSLDEAPRAPFLRSRSKQRLDEPDVVWQSVSLCVY